MSTISADSRDISIKWVSVAMTTLNKSSIPKARELINLILLYERGSVRMVLTSFDVDMDH